MPVFLIFTFKNILFDAIEVLDKYFLDDEPFEENKKSWKGYDFEILNKLHEEEYIYQENKHKYFIWEEKGILEAERLIEKYNINKD